MRQELRRFGFNLGLGLNILGCVMFYRGRGHFIWFTAAGSLCLIFAILYPRALSPLKKAMDFIILYIGRAVNLISLAIAFYLIFTPIALLLKVFGRDLLNQRIEKDRESYWLKRKEGIFSAEGYYERMG